MSSTRAGSSSRGRSLYLERASVDATVHNPIKAWAALIEGRRWREGRITGINCRAAGQQFMRQREATIVLQRAKDWIGVDLITGAIQQAATIIAAEVIAE